MGITPQSLTARRRRESWPPRSPVAARSAGPASRGRPRPATKRKPPRRSRRRRRKAGPLLIHRLYDALMSKVEQMEERMSQGRPQSPADNERDTRALTNLVRNYEKVKEVDAELARAGKSILPAAAGTPTGVAVDPADAGAADSEPKSAGTAALAPDTDRLRRELAQRIERLRQRAGA